jgi:hypothetical protein
MFPDPGTNSKVNHLELEFVLATSKQLLIFMQYETS